MSDVELLRAAAMAAGLMPTVNCNDEPCWTTGHGSGCFRWNPLNDDGDAFRLAHKLNLLTDVYSWPETIEDTRRAIVEAAAMIGRSKP